ncbi:hypothetical protein [Mucilaginibacter sp.]|jgi:hypothetical protein|uniref:hypothetical protein n=1 Tax=Mucilaginibacter sp. TaxID=1882438 RepID=UPI0026248DBB|nr:hypothetical protein [Mucilaginibacter sp.]MDB4926570.1 hypothetical protein [Mucilaginibacter sp.]
MKKQFKKMDEQSLSVFAKNELHDLSTIQGGLGDASTTSGDSCSCPSGDSDSNAYDSDGESSGPAPLLIA